MAWTEKSVIVAALTGTLERTNNFLQATEYTNDVNGALFRPGEKSDHRRPVKEFIRERPSLLFALLKLLALILKLVAPVGAWRTRIPCPGT